MPFLFADYPTDDRETFLITEFEGRDFLMPYAGRFDIDVGRGVPEYGVKPVIRPCHVDDETVIRMVGKGIIFDDGGDDAPRQAERCEDAPGQPSSVSREPPVWVAPGRPSAGWYRRRLAKANTCWNLSGARKGCQSAAFYLNFTVFPSDPAQVADRTAGAFDAAHWPQDRQNGLVDGRDCPSR